MLHGRELIYIIHNQHMMILGGDMAQKVNPPSAILLVLDLAAAAAAVEQVAHKWIGLVYGKVKEVPVEMVEMVDLVPEVAVLVVMEQMLGVGVVMNMAL